MELGEASQDSTGFAAMEEGLISRSGRNLRVPAELGQESQASSCVKLMPKINLNWWVLGPQDVCVYNQENKQ